MISNPDSVTLVLLSFTKTLSPQVKCHLDVTPSVCKVDMMYLYCRCFVFFPAAHLHPSLPVYVTLSKSLCVLGGLWGDVPGFRVSCPNKTLLLIWRLSPLGSHSRAAVFRLVQVCTPSRYTATQPVTCYRQPHSEAELMRLL